MVLTRARIMTNQFCRRIARGFDTAVGVAAGIGLVPDRSRKLRLSYSVSEKIAEAEAAPAVGGARRDRVAALQELGFSEMRLQALTPFLQTLDTTALMIVGNGKVLYEYGDLTKVSYLASCRKSVLSMLYGKYVETGQIRLNCTLRELGISDVGGLMPSELEATIDDLLTSRSAVFHKAAYHGDALRSAPPRGTQKAGHYYIYNNWDFNVLGSIFEQLTGKGIYQALQDDLAAPLQMDDFDLASQRKEGDGSQSEHLAYPINLSTRDMARLGELMLSGGKWSNCQLVPNCWIEKTTSLVTMVDSINPPTWRGYAEGSSWGYGRLWWVWDDRNLVGPFAGAYTGWGVHGQFITVLPALGIAVAHKVVPGKSNTGIRRNVSAMQYQAILMHIVASSDLGAVETRQ